MLDLMDLGWDRRLLSFSFSFSDGAGLGGGECEAGFMDGRFRKESDVGNDIFQSGLDT